MQQGGTLRNVEMCGGGVVASNRAASIDFRNCTFSKVGFHVANATFTHTEPCYMSNASFYIYGNVNVFNAQDSWVRVEGESSVISNCEARTFYCYGNSSRFSMCRMKHTIGDVWISGTGNSFQDTIFTRDLQD